MKRWRCALIAAGLPLQVAAAGPSREAERKQLIVAEKAWGQAFVTGDVATVQRLLADDFHGIDTNGAGYDKARMIADMRAGPAITSDRVDQAEVRFYGDVAVVEAHELVEGPAPEAHPSQRVFSDTWVKRGGQWRIVSAMDMKVGLATLPQFASDADSIRSLRAASNRAIAAHDMAAFLPTFADDAVFTWSNGSHAIGKVQLAGFFAKDFADPRFDRYVRTPGSISVSDRGVRAIERGSWTALKTGTRYGGDYVAHWMKAPAGWQIVGELYGKLYCSGTACTP